MLFSVIVNNRNGANFLDGLVRSIEAQSLTDYEVIFYDNVSTDNSVAIIESIGNQKVKVIKHPFDESATLYDARNLACDIARGDYLAFLDIDDRWHPDKLRFACELFETSGADLVFTNYWKVFDSLRGAREVALDTSMEELIFDQQLLLRRYPVCMSTLAIKRSVWKERPFNTRFQIIGDFDFVLSASSSNRVVYDPRVLTEYLVHDSSLSHIRKDLWADELFWLSANADYLSAIDSANLRWDSWYLRALDSLARKEYISAIEHMLRCQNFLLWLKFLVDVLGLKPFCKKIYRERKDFRAIR